MVEGCGSHDPSGFVPYDLTGLGVIDMVLMI